MSQVCRICGKRPHVGNRVARRGRAKYLGGVGRKITGISKRQFRPNLQRVRAVQNGTVRRIRVCTHCLRSGKVTKPPARPRLGEAAEPVVVAAAVPTVATDADVTDAALETDEDAEQPDDEA